MLAASRWWLLWDGIYFWSVVLSGLLAGKRSVPQSVFILVNISSFANKIPGPLIEVKHQADRKGETYAGGGWYIVTQFSEGEGWENIQNFPQEEGWLVWLVGLRLSDSDVTGLTGLPEDRTGQGRTGLLMSSGSAPLTLPCLCIYIYICGVVWCGTNVVCMWLWWY